MRFCIALLVSKLYLFFTETIGHKKSDRVGLLAAKICPDFLYKIAKPKLVVMITGTNGKTTTTHFISNLLQNVGYNLEYSSGGANFLPGHIRTFINSVNIFNKSKRDAVVVECDELYLVQSLPAIKPNYLVVTNLCRDSIRRNAYSDYMFERLNEGIYKYKDVTLILNANDPISSNLGQDSKRIFVGANKIYDHSAFAGIASEFLTCPKCNNVVEYEFRHYRHIGKFKCPKCGYKNHDSKYTWEAIDGDNLVLNKEKYHIISNDVFNIYNEILAISLLKELNISDKKINEALKKVNVTKSREDSEVYKGINIYRRCAKGQNGTAPSIIFESISKNKNNKEIILTIDAEIAFNGHATMSWLYDNDFEILNDKTFKKIILTGDNTLDYKLRLLLAGVPEERIIICEDIKESHKFLTLDDSDIYIIFDVDNAHDAVEIADNIKKRLDDER